MNAHDEAMRDIANVRRGILRIFGRSKDSGRSLMPEADRLAAYITTIEAERDALLAVVSLPDPEPCTDCYYALKRRWLRHEHIAWRKRQEARINHLVQAALKEAQHD